MIFVDFNGNGQIDPADIAISLAINEDEENNDEEEEDDIPGNDKRIYGKSKGCMHCPS